MSKGQVTTSKGNTTLLATTKDDDTIDMTFTK